jgi:hypothetical protein
VVTNNQQMLMISAHSRYEKTNYLLTVSSVTASVNVFSRAQVLTEFGDSEDDLGNVASFSAGFMQEETPTTSYAAALPI